MQNGPFLKIDINVYRLYHFSVPTFPLYSLADASVPCAIAPFQVSVLHLKYTYLVGLLDPPHALVGWQTILATLTYYILVLNSNASPVYRNAR